VFATVEPCSSFDVNKNATTHRLEVVGRRRKCLYVYFYRIDAELGFCHVRVQSWFPFEIQVWVNGREALSRALDKAGIGHTRYSSSIVTCEDWEAAQALADKLAKRRWPALLNALARKHNPLINRIGRAGFGGCWWVADQVEVATDVAFVDRDSLQEVLPGLFAHATSNFSSTDVLRFLGRKPHPNLTKEVTSSTRHRPEGWRVKHTMGRNSIKVYDKANVLRVETTINDPSEFRVLRLQAGDDGHRHPAWRPMRKGVANLGRYHQVGRGANERYLEALSAASDHGEAVKALDDLCRPTIHNQRRTASFNPATRSDLALFKAVLAGEHAIVGAYHLPGAGDHQEVGLVAHKQHRLEPSQLPVGPPVAGQFHSRPGEVPMPRFQAFLECLEQREGIGHAAGKAGEHLAVVEGTDLFGPVLQDRLSLRHLPVPCQGAPSVPKHPQDRRTVQRFQTRSGTLPLALRSKSTEGGTEPTLVERQTAAPFALLGYTFDFTIASPSQGIESCTNAVIEATARSAWAAFFSVRP